MKTIKKEYYRIEVFPRSTVVGFSVAEDYEVCEEIVKQIRRHIDNVQSISTVYDQRAVCSFCGAPWTEDGNGYNGGCCDKDIEQNSSAG